MPYEGDQLTHCPRNPFDLGFASAVVVSGVWWNPAGHMLLNAGGKAGFYFQVAGLHQCPRYMSQTGYERYLHETGKKELRRFRVFIPDPDAAYLKLEELLSKPWAWWGVVSNCESFVEDIVVAGGGQRIHRGLLLFPVTSKQQGVFEWDSASPPTSSNIG